MSFSNYRMQCTPMKSHAKFAEISLFNLQRTQGEFLCNVTLLAIVLKFNTFRRIFACSYATLRSPLPTGEHILIIYP